MSHWHEVAAHSGLLAKRNGAEMLDAGRASHVYRGSCLPKACPTPVQRPARKVAGVVQTSSSGVARAMRTSQVLLRPIEPATSSLLASIECPFESTSTSRLDYGQPSADAYVSDFEDLRTRKDSTHRRVTRVAKHRPQRRSWSGDPFARRAFHKLNAKGTQSSDGGASSTSIHSKSKHSRYSGTTNNTLTWRGATFPWVSRFALLN